MLTIDSYGHVTSGNTQEHPFGQRGNENASALTFTKAHKDQGGHGFCSWVLLQIWHAPEGV